MNPIKIFVGIALIFMGISLLLISQAESVEYGGVVVIGPFPIIFASSPDMAVISIFIAAFFLLMLLFFTRW
jgi:uncharacterized protein (TIGR00304 family)